MIARAVIAQMERARNRAYIAQRLIYCTHDI